MWRIMRRASGCSTGPRSDDRRTLTIMDEQAPPAEAISDDELDDVVREILVRDGLDVAAFNSAL